MVWQCAAERQVGHLLHTRGSVPTSAEYAVFYDFSGGRIGFYDPVFLAKFLKHLVSAAMKCGCDGGAVWSDGCLWVEWPDA